MASVTTGAEAAAASTTAGASVTAFPAATTLLTLLLCALPLFTLPAQPVLLIKIKSKQEKTTGEKPFIGPIVATLGGNIVSPE
jgi:hypothetical protein